MQIKSVETDELITELQLKASSRASLVREHMERYPDIDVLITTEVAFSSNLAQSSGISNYTITEEMNDVSASIADNTIADRSMESGEMAALFAAGREAVGLIRGERDLGSAGLNTAQTTIAAASSTAIVAYLFG